MYPSCAGTIGRTAPTGKKLANDEDFVTELLESEASPSCGDAVRLRSGIPDLVRHQDRGRGGACRRIQRFCGKSEMMPAEAVLRCWTLNGILRKIKSARLRRAQRTVHSREAYMALCRGGRYRGPGCCLRGYGGRATCQGRCPDCDVSAGIGLIVGSQRQVACVFAPELPGPAESLFRLDHQVPGSTSVPPAAA